MKINIIKKEPDYAKKRVAAYCRVSTEHDEQEESLENQIEHYRDVIQSNPDYEYVDIYYDFGISGFKESRPGFQRMLEDCRKGRIDLILTKSISRFARNTDTVLNATRELKSRNIAVYFELQGINTLTTEGELMMTIYAAFAQAESESISSLGRMSYQRKYGAGIPVQYLERSFGYEKNEVGEYVIKEDEAKWVRRAYHMVADGYTVAAVKRYLNDNGVHSPGGVPWGDGAVFRMIENEIYKGDYLMHKHFVNADRRLVPNKGEVDSWYVEDDHVPIVSRKLWQRAQDSLAKRRSYLSSASVVKERTIENYPYMNSLFCAKCGHPLYPRVYSNGTRMSWGCGGHKRFGKGFCTGVNVPDCVVRDWSIDGNIYVYQKTEEKGIPEYAFYKENYWQRTNKKKTGGISVPALTPENYPYMEKIYCAKCGSRLVRYINTKSGRISWICNGYKRKGSSYCTGVRIFDEEVREWPIEADVYIQERRSKDGKKCHSYSSAKPENCVQEHAEP